MLNDLRGRIILQTDGQLKTGRDVVIAALLGAEEFGFSTGPLIASGCIMMRVCHLNTCPVGIATQDPELRKKFAGKPEHVINFMFFIAEEVREYMAQMGFRKFEDMVGQTQMLEFADAVRATGRPSSLDLSVDPLSARDARQRRHPQRQKQDHGLEEALDNKLIELARPGDRIAAKRSAPSCRSRTPTAPSARCSPARSPADTATPGCPTTRSISSSTARPARASAASWPRASRSNWKATPTTTCGKGLSGGRIIVYPPKRPRRSKPKRTSSPATSSATAPSPAKSIFAAWSANGSASATAAPSAVVEGVGDHGCEYMTGGRVVVIGPTGRNFAAGMSGGIAYVYNS